MLCLWPLLTEGGSSAVTPASDDTQQQADGAAAADSRITSQAAISPGGSDREKSPSVISNITETNQNAAGAPGGGANAAADAMSENADNIDELSTDDEEVGPVNLVEIYNTNLVLILIQVLYCHVLNVTRGTRNLSRIRSTWAKQKNIAIAILVKSVYIMICAWQLFQKRRRKSRFSRPVKPTVNLVVTKPSVRNRCFSNLFCHTLLLFQIIVYPWFFVYCCYCPILTLLFSGWFVFIFIPWLWFPPIAIANLIPIIPSHYILIWA